MRITLWICICGRWRRDSGGGGGRERGRKRGRERGKDVKVKVWRQCVEKRGEMSVSMRQRVSVVHSLSSSSSAVGNTASPLRSRRRFTWRGSETRRSAKGSLPVMRAAAGMDAAKSTIVKAAADEGKSVSTSDTWVDSRWIGGRWDFSKFKDEQGETDWDAVIDAEVARRKALELNPTPSIMEDPVNFDTSEIPWWAWIRRFHLPEAELVNGRAAMIGYFLGYVVDALSGHGLVDQTSGFLGKTLIFITIVGVCLVRNTKDIENLKGLADEATFYDKQVLLSKLVCIRPCPTKDFSNNYCLSFKQCSQ